MTTVDETAEGGNEFAYPEAWIWDRHGLRVDGTFVRTDRGSGEYGSCPIVVLSVDGVERAVWLNTTAVVAKFRDELRRRRARSFEPGERITIQRGEAKKTSGSGRNYWPFQTRFHDAPQMDDADVLELDGELDVATVETLEADPPSEAQDDDIPF